MLLHGEQYLQVESSIPVQGVLNNECKVIHVENKGKGAVVVVRSTTKGPNEKIVCRNESTVFVRGAKAKKEIIGERFQNAINNFNIPKRAPEKTVQEKTHSTQAALYRLSGDLNPLHM